MNKDMIKCWVLGPPQPFSFKAKFVLLFLVINSKFQQHGDASVQLCGFKPKEYVCLCGGHSESGCLAQPCGFPGQASVSPICVAGATCP